MENENKKASKLGQSKEKKPRPVKKAKKAKFTGENTSRKNLVLVGGGNPLQAAVQYGDERGADTFAAMYGYGPDQASALRKFETVENSGYGRVIAKGGTVTSIYIDITFVIPK